MNFLETLDTKFWESKLGLLPIKLFHSKDIVQQKFIMLNGVSNNFCLDIDPNNELDKKDYWNHAWSCDVGSFVRITNDIVEIYNWGKQDKVEKYDKDVVFERIDSFYKYLGEKQIPKENSIIPFATSIFRSLRNEFGEESKAEISLKAFLYMLAFVENGKPITDFNAWGLDGIDNHILDKLSPYINDLQNGIKYYDLKPNMSLILRHASGKLFQEAHYLATLDRQRTIWGTVSSKIDIQPEKYGTVHFTPSFVARSIVEEVLDTFSDSGLPSNLKIFDPAMGSGEFLKEILRQLKNKGYNGKVSIIGWDISKPAIDMAKFVLAFEQKEWNDNITIDLQVVENSLTKSWDNDFDIVLMNPPFLSWELLSDKDKESVHQSLGKYYTKKPNMASAFFLNATNCLAPNGVLGCVMPTSILNAESYINLREAIQEQFTHKLIAKLGNYIFQNAFTDACLYVGKKNKSNFPNTKIIWTQNIASTSSEALRGLRKLRLNKTLVLSEENYSVYRSNRIIESINWTPISYISEKLIEILDYHVHNKNLKLVKDIFNVKKGVDTGNNEFFLINKYDFEKMQENEKKYFRPSISKRAIINGTLLANTYIWYPYSIYLPKIENEEHLQKLVPTYYYSSLLKSKKNQFPKDLPNWWDLLRPRKEWQYNYSPRLISAAFGKAGSFAYDKSGKFVIERGHLWMPKNEERFSEDTHYAYLAIFCCDFFNSLLEIYSKQIASGWHLAKQFVNNIPIPDLTDNKLYASGEFQLLNETGRKLSDGSEIDKILLNQTVKTIYGIS